MPFARRRAAAVVAVAVLIPSMSGCWAGFGSQTSMQANQSVGNGINLQTGDIEVRGAIWVRNVDNPSEATLVGTFVNSGTVPDRLLEVTVDPPSGMGVTGGGIDIPVDGSVRTGFFSPEFVNALALQAFPSAFVTTTFRFERAGTVTGQLLSTLNTGTYAGVVVSPTEQRKLQKLAAKGVGEQDSAGVETPEQSKKAAKKATQNDEQ